MHIELSAPEQIHHQLAPETLQAARESVEQKGWAIIKSAFTEAQVAAWYDELMAILSQKQAKFLADMQAKGSEASGNNGKNRWSMHIPTDSKIFQQELYADKMLVPLLDALLGDNYVSVFISSEIAYKGSVNQPTHQDGNGYAISVMIPLVDVPIEKAPTEIWEKTHLPSPNAPFSKADRHIPLDKIAEIEKVQKSSFALVNKGDILIRDIRMLHRGSENHTDSPRPYIHILYYPIVAAIPPKWLTNLAVKPAKWLRNISYPKNNSDLTVFSNYVGQIPEVFAYSDRDFRRKIPNYSALSPAAQKMLRLADRKEKSRLTGNYVMGLKFAYIYLKNFAIALRMYMKT
jgi:ectoine hydroxylase-related dioxygenase (phytanoyl-CoA dioxygenase family)